MNDQIKRVSILGCGWLGLPLAEQMIWSGYQVKGSTTTSSKLPSLQAKGIDPYLLNLAEQTGIETLTTFLNTDCLVVSFPPRLGMGNGDKYITQIKMLADALPETPVKQVIFISSTSVYREVNATITEANSQVALVPGSPLLQAEAMLQQHTGYKTIILRFGGLVGGTRHPGRFLAGKTEVPQPEAPVNLIHLDDCLRLCMALIAGPARNEVYHAVADQHPSRHEFYTAAARALHLPPPQFAWHGKPAFKIISNEKIKAAYHYQFIRPDPMFFF